MEKLKYNQFFSYSMNSFYLNFNIFTLALLLILFSILFFRKNNSVTNRLLACIIIDPGLNFINNILIETGYLHRVPFVYFLFQATALLYAPLVLAYIIYILGEKFKWISPLTLLTLFINLINLYAAIEFYTLNSSQQYVYLEGFSHEKFPFLVELVNDLFCFVQFLYFGVGFAKIHRHVKQAREVYSNIESLKIRYIRNLLWLLTSLNFVLMVAYLLFPNPIAEYFFIPLIINIISIYILFYAFHHNAVFSSPQYAHFIQENIPLIKKYQNFEEPLCKELKEIKENEGKSRYKLNEAEIESYYHKIMHHFDQNKPYLNPSLNLAKLSSDLNACSHTISLTINSRFEMTFFDLVNSYRINYAKDLLNNNKSNRLTIDAIGFESGFNTSSSFYRAFKKHANTTPTQFLESTRDIVSPQ